MNFYLHIKYKILLHKNLKLKHNDSIEISIRRQKMIYYFIK